MAFKMKGFPMQEGISPIKQKVVPASKHEDKKGTMISEESDSKAEKIVDYEKRISDLKSDLKSGGEGNLKIMEKGKIISQVKKIEAQLKKLRS